MRCDVLVLGAGIVGLSTAVQLQKQGRAVVLVDRRPAVEETSYGNAGLIQRGGIVPYSLPRDVAKVVQCAVNLLTEANIRWDALARAVAVCLLALRKRRAVGCDRTR
jgi:D-lysine oxidase